MSRFRCYVKNILRPVSRIYRLMLLFSNRNLDKLFSISYGNNVYIPRDAQIYGYENIRIGKCFSSRRGLWMEAVICYLDYEGFKELKPQLIIGDNVSLGEYVHIGCSHLIKIGNNVLMGSKIYITDHNHGIYTGELQDSPDIPPVKRKLTDDSYVIIEDNVWIGEFVAILPGVTIGRGSIIGSHSTVTHDIPSECIAVGIPARVIKRWNRETKCWERV